MLNPIDEKEVQSRVQEHVLTWRISVDEVVHTATSVLVFGHRHHEPVVLKVVKRIDGEWLAGQVLDAFAGRGVVRVVERGQGAMLLERLVPGRPLAHEEADDDEATFILADVIRRMSPGAPPSTTPTVDSWEEAFHRYRANGTIDIPNSLLEAAHRTSVDLCESQAATRLLHGDLHHGNVLLDSQRGWLAIDPKGVVGELAFEVGAALRNPCEHSWFYAEPATIRKRVAHFAAVLGLDTRRMLAWAFAQAILAAIWELEDEGVLQAGRGWIALAHAIRPMLARDSTA
jgi:streptomycin 6-kinase